MDAPYTQHRVISLKTHPVYNEAWVQDRIAEDSAILGLGELVVRNQQRSQSKGGRLDMLLVGPAPADMHYELELQLGATDESHIIRTIEYWDNERVRYPQYDHVAVIVAEEVTGRFFNVISLFNRTIPLIAIQMSLIDVNGAVTLVFSKVLDLVPPGSEEDERIDEPTNRAYWEAHASSAALMLTDGILEMIREVDPSVTLKFNKRYVGLSRNGVASNFVAFAPRRDHVIASFRVPRSDELTDRLEKSGMELLEYEVRRGQYRMQIQREDLERNAALIRELVRQARDNYRA